MLGQKFPVLLALVLSAGWAGAQPRDAAAADALFREARSLMKDGMYAEACPKLAESQRLDPAAGTGINLGDCYQKTGKLADALQSLRDALDMLALDDPRRDPVKQEMAALEKRVPRLTIKLAPNSPEGTKVTRDGVEYGAASLGVPLPVNPGDQWVVVTSPGHAKKPHRIALVEGQIAELAVGVGPALSLDAPSATAAATPLEPSPYSSGVTPTPVGKDALDPQHLKYRTASYVVAGVGAVGLVIATPTYFYLRSKEKAAQAGDAEARDSGKSMVPVFYGALGVAVVGLGLGGYLYFSEATPARSATTVSVAGSPLGASVQMRSSF